jgi:hypothetical protein
LKSDENFPFHIYEGLWDRQKSSSGKCDVGKISGLLLHLSGGFEALLYFGWITGIVRVSTRRYRYLFSFRLLLIVISTIWIGWLTTFFRESKLIEFSISDDSKCQNKKN